MKLVVKQLAKPALPERVWIPWILMCSYLYYVHDYSLLHDTEFDLMCRNALRRWETLEHPHKALLSREKLQAASLFEMRALDYPTRLRGAALHLKALCDDRRLLALDAFRDASQDRVSMKKIVHILAREGLPAVKKKVLIIKRKN